MYKEIKKLTSTLDEYALIPSSATERDLMLRWFPNPQIPGHVTKYEWDAKLEKCRVWQEPVAGEGKAAAATGTAKAADPATLPPEQQPGTYVADLQKLTLGELETKAGELSIPNIPALKKKTGHLLAAVARKLADAAIAKAAAAAKDPA